MTSGSASVPSMPVWRDGCLRKRWRYVGVYAENVMLCAGVAWIGPAPQAFWAVWDRQTRQLTERTAWFSRGVRLPDGYVRVRDGHVAIDLRVEAVGEPIEVTSPHGRSYIWTRKQPLRAVGGVRVDGVERRVDASGLLDDSAGYYARRTDWEWSAGVGTTPDGAALTWNLVCGVHDVGPQTECTVWVDGVPHAAGTMKASPALDHVTTSDGGDLHFTAEAVRERHDKAGRLMASEYVQPFGVFGGTLPGGIDLAAGLGVMERHSAMW